MRVHHWLCGSVVLMLVGCGEPEPVGPSQFEALFAAAGELQNFNTALSGAEEVPPNASRARGQAQFQLNKDGDALSYQLIVANLENFIMAHIHPAAAGENGPVVVWLRPEGPPAENAGGGRIQGVIARGTITEDDLVGPLADESFADLIEAMRDGNTYVNVHTSDGTGDLGPGNLPAGEIRGQIHPRGPMR